MLLSRIDQGSSADLEYAGSSLRAWEPPEPSPVAYNLCPHKTLGLYCSACLAVDTATSGATSQNVDAIVTRPLLDLDSPSRPPICDVVNTGLEAYATSQSRSLSLPRTLTPIIHRRSFTDAKMYNSKNPWTLSTSCTTLFLCFLDFTQRKVNGLRLITAYQRTTSLCTHINAAWHHDLTSHTSLMTSNESCRVSGWVIRVR